MQENYRTYLVFLLMCLPAILSAQHQEEKFAWWNKKHNWDGHTPWPQYITLSSSHMGPNAIPPLEVFDARIKKSAEFQSMSNYYFNQGDETVDLNLKFVYPVMDRVQFELWMVPVEYFHISDTLIRDERAIRYENPEGTATGDLYAGAHLMLLNRPQGTSLSLGFAVKTASGSKLSMARYTDTPGYYFDFSAGHSFSFQDRSLKKLRIYAMAGFMAYQTYDLMHNQNDAFLYGLGAEANFGKLSVKNDLAGYIGYLDIGDKPMVYRLELELAQKYFHWLLRYQYGIIDFPYQSIGLGFRWEL